MIHGEYPPLDGLTPRDALRIQEIDYLLNLLSVKWHAVDAERANTETLEMKDVLLADQEFIEGIQQKLRAIR